MRRILVNSAKSSVCTACDCVGNVDQGKGQYNPYSTSRVTTQFSENILLFCSIFSAVSSIFAAYIIFRKPLRAFQ